MEQSLEQRETFQRVMYPQKIIQSETTNAAMQKGHKNRPQTLIRNFSAYKI